MKIKGNKGEYVVRWVIHGHTYVQAVVYKEVVTTETTWRLFRPNKEKEVTTLRQLWSTTDAPAGWRSSNLKLKWVYNAEEADIKEWFQHAVDSYEKYLVAVAANKED